MSDFHTVLPELGKIFIGEKMEYGDGSRIAAMLHDADHKLPQNEPITVYLNTLGGGVDDGFQVADTIRMLKRKVVTVGQGKVNSMGVLVLAAGDERYATPLTTFMCHEFWMEHAQTSMSVINARQEWLGKKLDLYNSFLAERTGKSVKFWRDRTQPVNQYLGVKEALKYRLIHGVLSYKD